MAASRTEGRDARVFGIGGKARSMRASGQANCCRPARSIGTLADIRVIGMWFSRLFKKQDDAIYVRSHWIFSNRSSNIMVIGRRYN